MNLEVGSATDKGPVRQKNQDSIGIYKPATGLFKNKDLPLYILADGMGGHQAGEVASGIAVNTIIETFYADRNAPTEDRLEAAILAANRSIIASAASSRMGTTAVVATMTRKRVCVANVGDSRAYLVHDQSMIQLTRDHSLLAERQRHGLDGGTGQNVLTRSLGNDERVKVDLFSEDWQPGDQLLLCSDGLWGVVSDDEVLDTLLNLDPQPAAEALIQAAVTNHTRDNISVIIIRAM